MSFFLLSLLLVPTVFSDEIRARRRLEYDDCVIEEGTFKKVSGTHGCRAELHVHGSLWVTANTRLYASSVHVSDTGSMVWENGVVWTPSTAPPPATSPNQPPTTTTTPPPFPRTTTTPPPTTLVDCTESCVGWYFGDTREYVCETHQCSSENLHYVDLAYGSCADLDVATETFTTGCCDVRTCDGGDIPSMIPSASPSKRPTPTSQEEGEGCSQSCEGLTFLDGPHQGEDVCAAEQCVNSGVNGEFYVDLAYAYCTADLDVASETFENGCCDVRTCDDSIIISNSPTPYLLSASPTVYSGNYDNEREEDDTDDDQGCLSIDGEMCTGCKGRLGRCNNLDYASCVSRTDTQWCGFNSGDNDNEEDDTDDDQGDGDDGEGCSPSCVGLTFSDGEDVCAAEQCVKSDEPNAAVYVDLAYALCGDLNVALDIFVYGCCDTRTCRP